MRRRDFFRLATVSSVGTLSAQPQAAVSPIEMIQINPAEACSAFGRCRFRLNAGRLEIMPHADPVRRWPGDMSAWRVVGRTDLYDNVATGCHLPSDAKLWDVVDGYREAIRYGARITATHFWVIDSTTDG